MYNERIGTAIFLEILCIERYKYYIEGYAIVHKFHYERFFTVGEFIIRGSTVVDIAAFHCLRFTELNVNTVNTNMVAYNVPPMMSCAVVIQSIHKPVQDVHPHYRERV